ncbi:glutathionylspermidine synthase family protein [Aliiglaciecola sp. LCG003]|uniref:glutathionylspermidine synthase family protein n=1 Tax=Aliiglaciecola sp. LCG003 TaxID=3053655 RepID=UPI0025728B7F|nr:glutathionylspermidine synthase family protein [Aliiglaciecola sp. LCG003]WJG08444.1 glutathionylspermidine synthase family protein [Aliiglaciecola sp. LCG003]
MIRLPIDERLDWQQQADKIGFHFHTMYGDRYWDERAYYSFTREQIENDLEDPTEELNQMALHVVDNIINDEELLKKFAIPASQWDLVRHSWRQKDPSLYGRIDLSYDGSSPAKLLEMNMDTPTSVFEAGHWQWLWLEQNVDSAKLPRSADQFNSIQEKLIYRFADIAAKHPNQQLHFACCKDTKEDLGTIEYLASCAAESGIPVKFSFIEDIGITQDNQFTDLDDELIEWIFKLYPWEFMMREEFGDYLAQQKCHWLEPPWKSLLSNKAILPLLWSHFPKHPNLLPAYFADQQHLLDQKGGIVRKPIFSREGANIKIQKDGKVIAESDGFYGDEGFIYQGYAPLPKFGDYYTLIGSWLVGDKAAGLTIREDGNIITQDMSRFVPHIIID